MILAWRRKVFGAAAAAAIGGSTGIVWAPAGLAPQPPKVTQTVVEEADSPAAPPDVTQVVVEDANSPNAQPIATQTVIEEADGPNTQPIVSHAWIEIAFSEPPMLAVQCVPSTATVGVPYSYAFKVVLDDGTVTTGNGTSSGAPATTTSTGATGPSSSPTITGSTTGSTATTTPPPMVSPLTDPPSLPTGGNTIHVPLDMGLQAALDAAQPGDTILVSPGTYTGPFTLPLKSGSSYIVVRSAVADTALPGDGVRVSPSDAVNLPLIQSGDVTAAIQTVDGSHHWRLQWLQFGANVNSEGDIIQLGNDSQSSVDQVPHDLVIDRCLIQGDPTNGQKRGISMNSASTWVVNSYIAGIRKQGQDSQCIASWNGTSGFVIANNYLEAASENILFGGADTRIPNNIPSDIVIKGNYCFKPLAWKTETGWTVKNLLELKNAQRVLIDGNLFENNWVDGQSGHAIVFTVRNQDGSNPWATLKDVTFQYNVVKNTEGFMVHLLGTDTDQPSTQALNLTLQHNLGIACGGGVLIVRPIYPLNIQHVTWPTMGGEFVEFDAEGVFPSGTFTLQNCAAATGAYGVIGASYSPGTPSLDVYAPGYVFDHNAIGDATGGAPFPTGNTILSAAVFAASLDGQFRYTGPEPSTDGPAIGANIDAIRARIPWLVLP